MKTIVTTKPSRLATGNRKITQSHQMAAMLARQFNPDPDFDRFEAVRILERYGTRLPERWSRSLIAHVRLLVSHTQNRDWIDGKPIVYMSVARTAEKLGISVSQVNYNERQLIRLKAITHIDSGNYKRYARRCPDTGRILDGRGVNLAPLGHQLGFLRNIAAIIEDQDQRRQRLRDQYTSLRRYIRGVFDALVEGEPWQGRVIAGDQLQAVANQFTALLGNMHIGRRTTADEIEAYIAQLTNFLTGIAPANAPDLKGRDKEDKRLSAKPCDAHRIQTEICETNTSNALNRQRLVKDAKTELGASGSLIASACKNAFQLEKARLVRLSFRLVAALPAA